MILARSVSSAARIAIAVCLAVPASIGSAQTIRQGSVVTSTAVRQPSNYVPLTVRSDVGSPYVDLQAAIERGRKELNPSRLPDPTEAKKRLAQMSLVMMIV